MKAKFVLDSSALLAWMFDETGKEVVSSAFEKGCLINSVNWSEVVQKVNEHGIDTPVLYQKLREMQILNVVLTIVDMTESLAVTAGELFPLTKPFGLSLGDRACIALSTTHKLPALTTDRDWAKVTLDINVQLIR